MFIQSRNAQVFGVDIHPACVIGRGIMLDHATGIVIGETTVIEDNVSILQQVTLGGTGNEQGNRHPKIKSGVSIYASSTILGNITLGKNSTVAAGSLVLKDVEPIILILAIATLIIFLTEMTSNVATTSTFLPVIGSLAIALGVVPVSLTIPVCLAASCAFMLPVATPPNAIVYGSGKFTIATMMRAGFFINIVGILVVTLMSYYLAPLVF